MWILCCQISTNRNGVRNCFQEDWSSRYIGEDWVCWLNQPSWSTSQLMEKCRLMDKYTQDCKLMSLIISEEQGKMEHDLSRKFQWYLLLLANPSNQPSYQWICLFLILKKGGKRKKGRNLSNHQLSSEKILSSFNFQLCGEEQYWDSVKDTSFSHNNWLELRVYCWYKDGRSITKIIIQEQNTEDACEE